MDALTTALSATLPAFFLIGLGAYADRRFPELDLETLTRLSVYFFIPALVFNALIDTTLTLQSAALLSLGYVLYLLALGALALPFSAGLSGVQVRGVLVTSLFGNTGNMGLPITLFAYGIAGLERAIVLLVISLGLMFALGPALLSGKSESVGERIISTLKLPPIWATLAGVGYYLLSQNYGVSLPVSAERGIALLGNAAIPIMLMSLGMQMHRSWTWSIGGAAWRATGLRLLAGPLIAYGVAVLLGLEPLDRNVLVLSATMPAAVTMFVVAVEVQGDYEGVARTVVATTIGSLAAITAVIFLFPGG
ncbi:MAG: AEC family transporter [Trueperaceae bacterium]|nr:AEC family transporter [Trueperaceae bacterium]